MTCEKEQWFAMKRSIGLWLFGIALGLGLCSGASASGRGLTFGLNAGIGPTVWSYSAYRFGVEAGYRFSTRFGALVRPQGSGRNRTPHGRRIRIRSGIQGVEFPFARGATGPALEPGGRQEMTLSAEALLSLRRSS
jgi:hypothetical protein